MVDAVQIALMPAAKVAREAIHRASANGVRFAVYGEAGSDQKEVERVVQAVPAAMAAALERKTYFFVPLTIAESAAQQDRATTAETGSPDHSDPDHSSPDRPSADAAFPDPGETLVAAGYSMELGDRAICHRNVVLDGVECVFISMRLMQDKFALAFEFFINIGHAFSDIAGVPESFAQLAWSQALADVRGETSQDAWESRRKALGREPGSTGRTQPARIDEKAKTAFLDSAFADAIAIYLLSLTVDFDYTDLREREYPLLAAPALADRLRLVAGLFPPNHGYEFSILYRRRS